MRGSFGLITDTTLCEASPNLGDFHRMSETRMKCVPLPRADDLRDAS